MSLSKEGTSLSCLAKEKDAILLELLRIFSSDDSPGNTLRSLKALRNEVKELLTRDYLSVSNEEVATKLKDTVCLLRRIRPAGKITFYVLPQPTKRKLLVKC